MYKRAFVLTPTYLEYSKLEIYQVVNFMVGVEIVDLDRLIN
jgi:hypothetical protein